MFILFTAIKTTKTGLKYQFLQQSWNGSCFNFFPISSFHLFIHPILGLDCHNAGGPLHMEGLFVHDVIACCANFFRLFNVVNNLFAQRKYSFYASSRWHCSIETIFWRIIVAHFRKKAGAKHSWCWTWIKLGPCWKKIYEANALPLS